MKLLFCGDVVGRSGREAVLKYVPKLRTEKSLDFVVVNGDNAAAGFGITPDICKEFFTAGVDVVTGGDHIWDQKEITSYIGSEKRLLRPHNFPSAVPGTGIGEYKTTSGKRVVVLHLLGQVFMREYLNSPFECAEASLKNYTLGASAAAIIVDFHAEATSEKMAMGKFLDGKVSMVVGSHTHVPTADSRILPKGTAYQTDTGMCGDYDSVIGFEAEGPMARFTTKLHKTRMTAASGEATFCALLVETDDKTGLAKTVEFLSIDGRL